jgi:hypothetical protein
MRASEKKETHARKHAHTRGSADFSGSLDEPEKGVNLLGFSQQLRPAPGLSEPNPLKIPFGSQTASFRIPNGLLSY